MMLFLDLKGGNSCRKQEKKLIESRSILLGQVMTSQAQTLYHSCFEQALFRSQCLSCCLPL